MVQCCTWTSKSAASRKDVSLICKRVCTEVQDGHQKQSKTACLPAYQHLCIPASQMHISDSLHPCIFCTPGVLASSDPGALWPDSDLVKAFIMFYQIIKSNHCLPLSLMNSRNDWILSCLVDLMPVSDANCFMKMILHVQQLPKVQSLYTRQFHKNTFFGNSYCPKLIRGPGANRN